MSFEKTDILRRRVPVGSDDYPEGAVRLGAESVDASMLSDQPITDMAILRVLDSEGRPMEGFTYHVQNHSSGGMTVRVFQPKKEGEESISNCTAYPSGMPVGEGQHFYGTAAFAVIVGQTGRVEVATNWALDGWSLIILANPAPEHHGETHVRTVVITDNSPTLDAFRKALVSSDHRLMLPMSNPRRGPEIEVQFRQPGEEFGKLSLAQRNLAHSLMDGFAWMCSIWRNVERTRGMYLHSHKGKKPKRGWPGKHRHRLGYKLVAASFDFETHYN